MASLSKSDWGAIPSQVRILCFPPNQEIGWIGRIDVDKTLEQDFAEKRWLQRIFISKENSETLKTIIYKLISTPSPIFTLCFSHQPALTSRTLSTSTFGKYLVKFESYCTGKSFVISTT